jgi:hypothetical protein
MATYFNQPTITEPGSAPAQAEMGFLDAKPPAAKPAPADTDVFRFEPASGFGAFHFYPCPRNPSLLVKCQLTPPRGLPEAFAGISIFSGTEWLDLWPVDCIPIGQWLQLRDPSGAPLPLAVFRRGDAMFGRWL